MRKEKFGTSAEAVQNKLSFLPGCCSWEVREREKKKEEKEKKEIFGGLRAVAGAGTQPQPRMKQTGQHEAKPRLRNEQ